MRISTYEKLRNGRLIGKGGLETCFNAAFVLISTFILSPVFELA